MDRLEGLNRKRYRATEVITGHNCGWKQARMNHLTIAAINAGKSVAIIRADGIISFKPFGDYVEIKYSPHD